MCVSYDIEGLLQLLFDSHCVSGPGKLREREKCKKVEGQVLSLSPNVNKIKNQLIFDV